jgi:hypothetical protein
MNASQTGDSATNNLQELSVPKETAGPTTGRESRRSFLSKLGLGAAALAAVSSPLGWLGRRKSSSTPEMSEVFPGEDSIFHPASDPRLDPRRRQG